MPDVGLSMFSIPVETNKIKSELDQEKRFTLL